VYFAGINLSHLLIYYVEIATDSNSISFKRGIVSCPYLKTGSLNRRKSRTNDIEVTRTGAKEE